MSVHDLETQPLKAVLVGVQLPRVSDQENTASLDELARLVTTLGYEVVGRTSQRRSSTKSATVLGDGKLMELAKWTGGTGKVTYFVAPKKHKAYLRFEKTKMRTKISLISTKATSQRSKSLKMLLKVKTLKNTLKS